MTFPERDNHRPAPTAAGYLTFGLLSVLILLAGLSLWAASARLAGAIVAPGKIAMADGQRPIQHPDGGVLEALFVRDGDYVKAGTLLAKLGDDGVSTDLAVIEGRLREIKVRRLRLKAERDGKAWPEFDSLMDADPADLAAIITTQGQIFAARRDGRQNLVRQLHGQRAGVANQSSGADAELAALLQQYSLINDELARQATLFEKGLVPVGRLRGLELEVARVAGEIGGTRGKMAELDDRLVTLGAEQARIPIARREEAVAELADLDFAERELIERRRTQVTRLAGLDLRAPIGGDIFGLKASGPGSVVRPAETLMILVPRSGGLTVEAKLAPTDIGRVALGQSVGLRLGLFNAGTIPELTGTLVRISPDSLSDPGVAGSYYTAAISLEDTDLARLPRPGILRPGMPVEVVIRTGERTAWTILTRPFSDFLVRAFRSR